MRGQKKKMQGMKLGRTIAAERERAESDSERMLARKSTPQAEDFGDNCNFDGNNFGFGILCGGGRTN